ncbi:unnamed protein product, partial [Amoebophrya sp. A120]
RLRRGPLRGSRNAPGVRISAKGFTVGFHGRPARPISNEAGRGRRAGGSKAAGPALANFRTFGRPPSGPPTWWRSRGRSIFFWALASFRVWRLVGRSEAVAQARSAPRCSSYDVMQIGREGEDDDGAPEALATPGHNAGAGIGPGAHHRSAGERLLRASA